ncbi:MAG TPA: hypothetical protein VNQ90_17865 [Chthoniobacteraceae bacterium]|nr:hypothetical protein [Chthoniobacteraceae bacterium]
MDSNEIAKAEAITNALPEEGLFSEKSWLVSPTPFMVEDRFADELEKLGYRLHLFVQACNQLYFASVKGRQPRWIAELLDRGKPPHLIEAARRARMELPPVIRPDLVLTEEGFAIAELDSVPGGIGLTAWLGRAYGELGYDLLGGASGMFEGFAAITPEGADIVVSDEAATYRPEMRWLAGELNQRFAPACWEVLDTGADSGPLPIRRPPASVYRFFELFDLPNLPATAPLLEEAAAGTLRVTPPFKPFLEEKLWFALFWLKPLREFWRRELSERQFLNLQKVIPYTWLVDPAPLPPHAVLPQLEVNDWGEVMAFSQKQRDLILKISGFSELAWGSRGVHLASDLPQNEWKAVLEEALASYGEHPYLLQRFHKGRLTPQRYLDPADGTLKTMNGRVRLCPYYFIENGKARLRGALATICPADKKLLHGMSDAIIVPTAVAPRP